LLLSYVTCDFDKTKLRVFRFICLTLILLIDYQLIVSKMTSMIQKKDLIIITLSVLLSTALFTFISRKDAELKKTDPNAWSKFVNQNFVSSSSYPPIDFINAAKIGTPAVVKIAVRNGGYEFWNNEENAVISEGSGVVISEDGYIVTNHHVISMGNSFEVMTSDKKKWKANLIGSDESTDIAVLKINKSSLPFLSLGNSDSVQIGQWVIAIGNPYQLSSTVTSGIVSAKGRTIDLLKGAYPLESFIQTDAVFNEGNSGGALLNARGELIGVNTAIFTKSGKFEGYSFAIPSNIVRKMVSDIMSYGKVQRAMLGVGIEDISDALSKKIGVDPETGVFINRISQGSAAEKAGMLYGDIITEINGKIVRSCPALQEQIALYKPGDIVNVKYLRNKNSFMGSLTLTSPISTASDVIIRSDLELKAIGIELREQVMRSGEKVVIVHTIYRNTPAGKTSMESSFVINEVNGMKVSSADDVISEIRKNNSQLILKGRYRNMNKNYEYQINRQGTGL